MTEFEKGDALIRVFHKVDPDALSDEDWARRSGEAIFVMQTFADILLGKIAPQS